MESNEALMKVKYVGIYIAYTILYMCRKNYPFWLRSLVIFEGMEGTKASMFGTAMDLAYGSVKLVAGPASDMFDARFILISVLLVSGFCNMVMFTFVDEFSLNISLWAINGVVQSFAWPAVANIYFSITAGLSSSSKGSSSNGALYSILTTSQNMASMISPLLLSALIAKYGWKSSLFVPGLVSFVYAFLLAIVLYQGEDKNKLKSKQKVSSDTIKEMLQSKGFWSLSFAYLFLTIIRTIITDWSLVFLQELHGIKGGESFLVSLEVGGFLGGLIAGMVSDRALRTRGKESARGIVMLAFSIILMPVLVFTIYLPCSTFTNLSRSLCGDDDTIPFYSLVSIYFIIGFFSFGPHMLIGLLSTELFPKSPSTAGSLTKMMGQVGASAAGYPLSWLVKIYTWEVLSPVLITLGTLLALSLLPLLQEDRLPDENKSKKKED